MDMQEIARELRADLSGTEAKRRSVKRLSRLCVSAPKHVVDGGGIQLVLDAIGDGSRDPVIIKTCTDALALMASAGFCDDLIRARAAETVATALRHVVPDVRAQESGCALLAFLAPHAPPTTARGERIAAATAVALAAHTASQSIQRRATAVLQHTPTSELVSATLVAMTATNGLPRTTGFAALFAAFVAHPESRGAILACGTLDAAIDARATDEASAFVALACRLDGSGRAASTPGVMGALAEMLSSASLFDAALDAIACVARDAPSAASLDALSTSGALDVIAHVVDTRNDPGGVARALAITGLAIVHGQKTPRALANVARAFDGFPNDERVTDQAAAVLRCVVDAPDTDLNAVLSTTIRALKTKLSPRARGVLLDMVTRLAERNIIHDGTPDAIGTEGGDCLHRARAAHATAVARRSAAAAQKVAYRARVREVAARARRMYECISRKGEFTPPKG